MIVELKSTQLTRFLTVGAINTAVDFSIFFVLSSVFGVYFVVATIISTTAAFVTSFLLNSRYTFKNVVGPRGMVLFIVVTLAGIWLVQPIAIYVSESILRPLLPGVDQQLILLASKVVASVASLVWNFTLYRKVVYAAR